MPRTLRQAPRIRIFFGCEGEGEKAYATLLQNIAYDVGIRRAIHIEGRLLKPGAGDPLAMVQLASRMIEQHKRSKFAHHVKAILLDEDRLLESHDRAQQAIAVARKQGIRLIWQTPKHETFLQRHFSGNQHVDPSADRAEKALQAMWPEYRKPMTAQQLAKRLGPEEVLRAAGAHDGLAQFLADIGLLAALRRLFPPD